MEVPPLYEGTLLFVIGCFILVGLIVFALWGALHLYGRLHACCALASAMAAS